MAFLKNIKRSFGFSCDDNVEFEDLNEDLIKKSNEDDNLNLSKGNELEKFDDKISSEQLKNMQLDIFNGVINVFNESLPDFIKSSVDIDAQRQYLYNILDQSIKDYLSNLERQITQLCESRWNSEKIKLHGEIFMLKNQCRDLESAKEESKRLQLSAERQKRALTTRLHDLEVQITSLEAEREQFDLENKSLINKLKVSNVKDNDIISMREEIERLQLALKESKANDNVETNRNIESEEFENLKKQISVLSDENTALKSTIEQLKVKEQLSDDIINDLNEKASQALREIEELKNNSQEINSESQEINVLQVCLDEKNAELIKLNAELEEARAGLQMIDQIQLEMEKFESIKIKKDAKIAELQRELKLQQSRVLELERDTESLKSTIENNLYNQAISEDLLRKEIKQLKEDVNKTHIKKNSKKERLVDNKVRISAIDESLDDADWLISVPPTGTITKLASSTDNDFGYQAPPKKSTPENDAQMSLW